jgi:hypothetical protein
MNTGNVGREDEAVRQHLPRLPVYIFKCNVKSFKRQ